MNLLAVLLILLIIGVGLTFVPLDGTIRSIIIAIIALCALFWLLQEFGIFTHFRGRFG